MKSQLIDVILIGGGATGRALATEWLGNNLDVVVIDPVVCKPDDWVGEWIEGLGVVNGPELVAILDPNSADERRLVHGRAIVIATGPYAAARPSCKMLGITKLGAEFTPDGERIQVDSHGRTRARGIYAAGKCASSEASKIVEDVVRYSKLCSSTS